MTVSESTRIEEINMHRLTRQHALTGSHDHHQRRARRRHRILGTTAVVVAGLLGGATTAAAAPVERGRFHDAGSELHAGECGIDVLYTWDISGSFLGVATGPDGLVRFRDSIRGTTTYTNVETGRSYTGVFTAASRDLRVSDNGDGTLTITSQAGGTEKWYDGDGKLVLMNPGLIRWQILVDDAGTPSDPYDDEFIQFLADLLGSTGRNDTVGRDFCEDLLLFTA